MSDVRLIDIGGEGVVRVRSERNGMVTIDAFQPASMTDHARSVSMLCTADEVRELVQALAEATALR
jgi:hypothetical protein